MSLMFSFKSWKLNNGVLTSFCATYAFKVGTP
jgi:hypothetical protein